MKSLPIAISGAQCFIRIIKVTGDKNMKTCQDMIIDVSANHGKIEGK